jgi:hypothetical protein
MRWKNSIDWHNMTVTSCEKDNLEKVLTAEKRRQAAALQDAREQLEGNK